MRRGNAWRWAALVLIAVVAALIVSFNAGERVALNLGFVVLYQLPLVPVIFVAFLAGMVTMFLVGLRHDLRVRRALREAGFGERPASPRRPGGWAEADRLYRRPETSGADVPPLLDADPVQGSPPRDEPPGAHPGSEPPPSYPP